MDRIRTAGRADRGLRPAGPAGDGRSPLAGLADPSRCWPGLLVVGKALDAATTAVGLRLVPGVVEANPVAAAALAVVGVGAGLFALSAAALLVVALATELGAGFLARREAAPAWGPTATRFVGYVPLSVAFVFAALHNAGLLARVAIGG